MLYNCFPILTKYRFKQCTGNKKTHIRKPQYLRIFSYSVVNHELTEVKYAPFTS